jgi:DNA repair protein RecN (Recombination protein N)
MLKSLEIHNYAIIDEIYIRFHAQMNIITGETGAGKSILIGALGLIAGERADSNVLFNKEAKCSVEAIFDIHAYNLQDLYTHHDIEYDTETIIRREIQPSGKSRAFINDTPVTLNVLKDISERLIEINSQNQSMELKSPEYQLSILDAFADNDTLLKAYQQDFAERKAIQKELDFLIEDSQKSAVELEYLQYQFNELTSAGLEDIHQENLEQELQTLENAEEIKASINVIVDQITNSDVNILDALTIASQSLNKLTKYNTELSDAVEKFDTIRLDLKEISKELSSIEERTEYDRERIVEIQEKLSLLYKLQKKHNTLDTAALIMMRDDMEARLGNIQNSSEKIDPLKAKVASLTKTLTTKATELSTKRKKVITKIEQDIVGYLSQLGMANSVFKININTSEGTLKATGMDEVQFLFTANKGGHLQELKKAISGGEMSRFMLSLKSVLATKMHMPTIIFDEIDTGVSGEVAHKVGEILNALSSTHQMIAITHLPQLASKGSHHLYVYKNTDATRTVTHIKILTPDQRIEEVAKMLSGEKVTDAALVNAKELLGS